MSRTNLKSGKRVNQDHYSTPIKHVEALLSQLVVKSGDTFLEPCIAEGNIYNRIPLPETQKSWAEIRMGVDYLKTDFGTKDIIITNPPFSLTVEFLEKSLSELSPTGTLAYLQRVNYFGTIKRVSFWNRNGFPDKTPILIPRPHFIKGGNDATEYCWMIYDRGGRFPFIPKGLSHLINQDTELKNQV